MGQKKYYIEYTVSCTDAFEEYAWYEGITSFLDPKKVAKDELFAISKKMQQQFYTSRTTNWRCNRDAQLTIGILHDGMFDILYSDMDDETTVEKLDKVLDTIPAILDSYAIYRNDFEDEPMQEPNQQAFDWQWEEPNQQTFNWQ